MTITAATVAARSTRPGVLVRLGDTRLSSRGDLSYGGYDWTAAGIALRGTGADGSGAKTVSLSLDDVSTAWPALILAGLDVGVVCEVYLIYVNDTGTIEDQYEFSGVVRQATVSSGGGAQQIQIEGVSATPDVSWTPRISWLSPFAVRRGTQVRIGSETYVLE